MQPEAKSTSQQILREAKYVRVLLIGGTGFLGSRVASRLQTRNHTVTVLTRNAGCVRQLEAGGLRTVAGDLLDPAPWLDHVGPQDLIVSMAMPAVPVGARVSPRAFLALQYQTTAMYSNTMDLARALGVPLIATSGASFHTRGAEVATEEWPIDRRGLAGLGAGADPLFDAACRTGSPPLIIMMPGQIYGNGGLFRNMMYAWMKQGRFRVIGTGENYIPRIHVDDCADAYVQAVEQLPLGERLIIADDTPCTVRAFSDQMADCMGLPRPGRIPAVLVRLAKGNLTYQTATMDCKVSNAKARRVLGWQPAYASYREGLPAVIAQIEKTAPP